jgi:hypothetical protein
MLNDADHEAKKVGKIDLRQFRGLPFLCVPRKESNGLGKLNQSIKNHLKHTSDVTHLRKLFGKCVFAGIDIAAFHYRPIVKLAQKRYVVHLIHRAYESHEL